MKLNCVYIHKNKNYNTVGGLQYIADHVADILKILDNEEDLHPSEVLAQVRQKLRYIKIEK
jgi:hypothetical protein